MVDRDKEWLDAVDGSDCEEEGFEKGKSVFKNFKVDTDTRLRKAFENDWALTKIPKLVKDKEELERVKELLKGEYPRLKNMWLAMTCDSSYPNFSFNDYAVWCQSCKFLPKEGVSLADLDTAQISAGVKTEKSKKIEGAKSELMRFEFLELIVRLAMLLYKSELQETPPSVPVRAKDGKSKKEQPKRAPKRITLTTAITRLFKEHINPAGFEIADTDEFRDNHLYTFKVNQFFDRNAPVLERLINEYHYTGGKKALKPEDALYLIQTIAGLPYLTERQIQRMYGHSKMTTVDLLKTPQAPKELAYAEFLEFLARAAHVAGAGNAAYESLPLYLKLDALVGKICKQKNWPRGGSMVYLQPGQKNILAEIAAQKKEEVQAAVADHAPLPKLKSVASAASPSSAKRLQEPSSSKRALEKSVAGSSPVEGGNALRGALNNLAIATPLQTSDFGEQAALPSQPESQMQGISPVILGH